MGLSRRDMKGTLNNFSVEEVVLETPETKYADLNLIHEPGPNLGSEP